MTANSLAIYTDDTAANVRECQRQFANYRSWYAQNKPIVRGETGVWQPGTNNPYDFGSGAVTTSTSNCGRRWVISAAVSGIDDLVDNNWWGMYALYENFLAG
ncbi:MAG: hypothetical protein U0559_01685 [Anaerolineae bacterium]